jgi:hypothetical protein
MDKTGDQDIKLNKPVTQKQISHVFSHMWICKGDLKVKA